jgi:CHASE2 domain-containing sensor protein
VNGAFIIKKICTKSALIGAVLAVLCGWLLLTPLGDAWINASYDNLYRFGHRAVTNQVALIRMDNDSYTFYKVNRGDPFDRALHTELLHKLTDDGARLVVFDVHFKTNSNPATDAALAAAIRQNGHVVLMADLQHETRPTLDKVGVSPPADIFLPVAAGCGVGRAGLHPGGITREHWPFREPNEGDFRSLGWAAAQVYGATWNTNTEKQWLRYYGKKLTDDVVPYFEATTKSNGYFKGKIVFIGNWPADSNPVTPEQDKFSTPYTAQTGKAVGGVEIMATTFLNLVHGEWLERLPTWSEVLLLALTGILIGGGLCQLKPLPALLVAVGIFLVVMFAFVSWSYYTNFWFPWLVICGGQLPCALAVALLAWPSTKPAKEAARYPGYETLGESFAAGAFGKVRLVRDQAGHLRALKEVNLKELEGNRDAYDREFHGLSTYMPISDRHLALLQVRHVRRFDDQGYFFYVMELSDPLDPAWDHQSPFEPFSLNNYCGKAGGRLAVHECLRIGIMLAEALDILHQADLVHRDIKPANIVFVDERPKLADVGLVRHSPREDESPTLVFTKGFADPRGLGTKQADIYALAITLYIISTGKSADSFSELPTTLVQQPEFMRLNEIICRACQPDLSQRYPTAAAMLAALRSAQSELASGDTQFIKQ